VNRRIVRAQRCSIIDLLNYGIASKTLSRVKLELARRGGQ
tara:strand:- start:197 stop:316 length:120 start_codon:yes stop_codon:yes gene_type:complete